MNDNHKILIGVGIAAGLGFVIFKRMSKAQVADPNYPTQKLIAENKRILAGRKAERARVQEKFETQRGGISRVGKTYSGQALQQQTASETFEDISAGSTETARQTTAQQAKVEQLTTESTGRSGSDRSRRV